MRYGQGSTDLFCDALLIAGTAFTTAAFALLAVEHGHPYDLLISAALLSVGIGLAFAALGNLIIQAVSNEQTGVASGMNTVMRTLGGALGGQLSATFIAAHSAKGHPAVTGFTETFVMATGFLVVCLIAGLLVPKAARQDAAAGEATSSEESERRREALTGAAEAAQA